MDYVAPATLEEAYRALDADDARCLAGGQSLVAMMNLGIVSPSRLVSLRRISALRGITAARDGSLRIGAMTSHAELAALDASSAGAGAARAGRPRGGVSGCARVRNNRRIVGPRRSRRRLSGRAGGRRCDDRGGIGRRLSSHRRDATSSADCSKPRSVAARSSPRSSCPRVRPPLAPPTRSCRSSPAISRFCRWRRLSSARHGSPSGAAVRARFWRPGLALTDTALREAARKLADESDPPSDHRASAAYRRRVLPELVCRAVRAARP